MFKLTKFLAGIVATGTIAYAGDLPAIKSSKGSAAPIIPLVDEPVELPKTKVVQTQAVEIPTPAVQTPVPTPTPTPAVQTPTPAVQTPTPAVPAVPMPATPAAVPPSTMAVVESATTESMRMSRFWGGLEYGIWRVERGPVANPLLVTMPPGDFFPFPFPGATESSRVLFGNENVSFPNSSGFTATLGAWLNDERTTGFEVSLLTLQSQNISRDFTTVRGGNVLAIPFTLPGGGQRLIAIGGGASLNDASSDGSINIQMDTRFWGYDAKAVFALRRGESTSLELVAGYRYLSLDEGLYLNARNEGVVFNASSTAQDTFLTSNRFHGGQVGLRHQNNWRGFSFDVAGLFSMGVNQQTIDISGHRTTTIVFAGIPQQANFGMLTHPTNSGVIRQNVFSVVPELNLKMSYNITEAVSLSVGYQGIYWTNVIRPGNLVDPVMNIPPGPFLGTAGVIMPFVSPTVNGNPVPQKVSSDFWAQGIMFGINVKY